jgi:hypothetical protein
VPLPCHSQRSWPVSSGQSRKPPQRTPPATVGNGAGGEPARSGFGSRGSLRPGYDRGCCLADPPSHPVAIEGHPWRQRHREGTCEFDLSTLGTQPGRQTLLPTACTSGGDRQEHRLPVKERWPTSRKSSKSTVRPGLSGWRVPTRRHRPVMRGNCPPSLGDPPPGWSVQDRPCRARPADRSLAAEDRSAGGVRDRTGAEPAGRRWVHAEPAGRGLQRAPAVSRGTEEQQVRRPARLPPGTISGVGPRVRVPLPMPSRSSAVLRRSLPLSYQLFGHVGLPLQPSHVRPRWARSSNPPAEPPCAGKIATWLSKMTLQEIASVRVHDKFQSGSAGEARSWASAVVVIQLGGTRRHVGPRPLPPDGRDRHHRRCE